jgi:hypothetical protein
MEKSIVEQAQYWREEHQRADIRWIEYKTTVAFHVSRDLSSGVDQDLIREGLCKYLTYLRHLLEAQHINAMAQRAAKETLNDQS